MKHIASARHSRQFRTKWTGLSHFKALVVFIFAIYGIFIPLWFAFHGNELLGNNDPWTKMVLSSTRAVRSKILENLQYHDGERPRRSFINKNLGGRIKSNRLRMVHRRARRHRNATGPKPLHSFDAWPMAGPMPPQPRPKIAENSGRLLSMKWEHLCCQSVNCLRKFPLFPLLPNKKRFLKRIRVSEKGQLYALRIAGLLKPPESGSYTFYVKCLSTCEFWLSDNEYPLHSKLVKKIVRGRPMEGSWKINNTMSRSLMFKASLEEGRAYFLDVLLTVYRYIKRPFEVLWKLPGGNNFLPISKEYFAGFHKNPESLRNVLKLYSHSPSVRLTSFLESIEESGEDDEDFTLLRGEKLNVNFTFTDNEGHPIQFATFSPRKTNVFSFSDRNKSPTVLPLLKTCAKGAMFSVNKTFTNHSGVWETSFTSMFPGDNTGHMMCIGNRYPVDCRGNAVISREKVSKLLTLYSQALASYKRNLNYHDHSKPGMAGLRIHQLVGIQEKVDARNGSLFLLDAILKEPGANRTYHDSQYFYMDKKLSSICIPQGYVIQWNATVNVIVVAKRQSRWLRHFLANMERIYVKTKEKHMNIIIAKYGNDGEQLMEEYQSNRLPSIRTVRHRGEFDKRKAIESAVKKIEDPNSIIFLMDLHILVSHTILELVRKFTIQGHTVFNPVLFRLSHCGSPATARKPARGFWETFGYGILGIYKSDWDNLGNIRTKKYKKGWGGEDWELLDRVLTAGLAVQRLRVANFYHFHHSKKGMWN